MNRWSLIRCIIATVVLSGFVVPSSQGQPLWDLACKNKDVLKVSTLFTAQNTRDYLALPQGRDQAVQWCKKTGVTRVFIETFRDGYTAEEIILKRAKVQFLEAGLEVSGCVTTTRVGKQSTGWNVIDCYTDVPTQNHLQEIFEYTASIFDEIMIDDFLFTDCQCDECKQACGDMSWDRYRCELMTRLSRQRILEPARAVNPNAKVIIKYPQWYDNFHNRGYEVLQQSADYDLTWVGTEIRDFEDPRWGGTAAYRAYYIMRWLTEIGGDKTGGGWFDPYGTHEQTYLEQARQTVLADVKEMLLFCYGSLQGDTGPANVEALRAELPALFELARLVQGKSVKGIAAPKPANSDPHDESYVYDFIGMAGLPLVPTAQIDTEAKAAFLPVHALKDPLLYGKLTALLDAGAPVLITDGLARQLTTFTSDDENLIVLKVEGRPKNLLTLSREELKPIRDKLLAPFGIRFDAPNKVALYLLGDNLAVIENFNDEAITASLEFARPVAAQKAMVLPSNAKVRFGTSGGKIELTTIGPRTLVALTY